MNTVQSYLCLILVVALCLTSCLQDDDGSVKINIDEEFDIALYEDLQPEQNRLLLHIKTIETLECSNYELGHSNTRDDDNIIISIDELQLEGDCDSAPSHIHTTASVGSFEDGEYNIEINLNLNSIVNEGKLTLTNGQYNLNMETTHGITISNDRLKTIPDGYLWGYVALLDSDAEAYRDEFNTNIKAFTRTADLPSGYYGHFNINNAGAFSDPLGLMEGVPDDAQYFIYKLDANKQELLSYVASFQSDQEGLVRVVLYTSEGEVL